LCREEAKALEALAAQEDKPLDGFGIFGVVKETGVDDEGLFTFHNDFFDRDLYRDENQEFYQALGKRKLSLNPFSIYKMYKASKRLKEKKIEGNLTGEGLVQGGVIIFGKDGKPKYCYEEKTGEELPVSDILTAALDVKDRN